MLTNFLLTLINAYTIVIFVYVILSWFPESKFIYEARKALGSVCDPYLDLFKRFIPPIGGVVDITPIIAVVVLQLIEQLLVFLL